MKNLVERSPEGLLIRGRRVLLAVTEYHAEIGLKHVTPSLMNEKVARLLAAIVNVNKAKLELDLGRKAFKSLAREGRTFALRARDILKIPLGPTPNPRWERMNFIRSLAVPTSLPGLLSVLDGISSHLKEHPEHENAPLNITAAAAKDFHATILAARISVGRKNVILGNMLDERTAAAREVRICISHVFNELKMLLGPNDPLWLAFSFNVPGVVQMPETPERVEVVAVDERTVRVIWPPALRATYYRVWKRVVGTEEELTVVGRHRHRAFVFYDLPPKAEVELAISAFNSAGETAIGPSITVRTPGTNGP